MARKGKKQVTVNVVTGKSRKQKAKSKVQQEVSTVGKALRYLGGLGGGALGSYVGYQGAGSAVGATLGAAISKWLGYGSYRVTSNSIVQSAKSSGSIPMMHQTNESIVVRHREYLCAISGSTGFTVQRYFPIQPGDKHTFPWLNGLAVKFQQYKIRGMVYHYVPTSGHAVTGTNPAIGSVMIQTSYRAGDSPPSTKVEMLNEYWASEASPAESFCHPIECSPKENPFNVHYVRSVPMSDPAVLPLYDMGKTFVATQGMQADGNPVGDLWVTYEIEFSKPQIASDIVLATDSGTANITTGLAAATPFGTGVTTAVGSVPFTVTGRTLTFPQGTVGDYLVMVSYYASGGFTAFDWSSNPSYSNCSAYALDSTGTYLRTGVTAGSSLRAIVAVYVTLTDPSAIATITFAAPTYTGTATNSFVSVSSVV